MPTINKYALLLLYIYYYVKYNTLYLDCNIFTLLYAVFKIYHFLFFIHYMLCCFIYGNNYSQFISFYTFPGFYIFIFY